MKNRKGFTLIEILAAVVILGIISSVTIAGLIKRKKTADAKLAKQLEQSLTQIGEDVYVYELLKGTGEFMRMYKTDAEIIISLTELKRNGYLKNVKNGKFINPANSSDTCDGYLVIKRVNSAPQYKGYINCGTLYTTTGYIDSNKTGNVNLTSH